MPSMDINVKPTYARADKKMKHIEMVLIVYMYIYSRISVTRTLMTRFTTAVSNSFLSH